MSAFNWSYLTLLDKIHVFLEKAIIQARNHKNQNKEFLNMRLDMRYQLQILKWLNLNFGLQTRQS